MIEILVTVLVVCLIVGVIYWIVTLLPIPTPFKQIAMAVCALILLIWLLNVIGVFGSPWIIHAPR